MGQAEQRPRQAVDTASGHRGRARGTASPIIKNARCQVEQGALGSLQVGVEVGIALQGVRAQVERVRIDDVQQHRPRKTCFGYRGAKSISASIYSSPRFFYVPVLRVEPANGGSNHYYIIDFRPAFLTGNLSNATRQSPGITTSDDNGVTIAGQNLTTMKVVFVNQAAIVEPEGGPVTPYLGRGPKLVRLIN